MRIVSLLPSATEILFAIGRGPNVVGVTHECDTPPAAAGLPRLTSNLLPPKQSARTIDAAVTASVRDAHTIYHLDTAVLAELRPDVVVTQSLCDVCAVSIDAVDRVLCSMPATTRVVDSNPTTLGDVLDSITHIGAAVGAEVQSRHVVDRLWRRIEAVAAAIGSRPRPRVAVVEWPDPVFAPGHWIPGMVTAAGGINVIGTPGTASHRIPMETLVEARPDMIVLAFCGFGLHETQLRLRELAALDGWSDAVRHARLIAVDGSAFFSRPGPRLIDGIELLAWVLHRPHQLRPPVRRGAELIEAGWVDVASYAPATAAL